MLVRDLDPDAVPLCEALDLWKEFVEIGRLMASGATLMARRVEEADTWRKGGHRSAADHMAGESGTSVSETKRQIETSKRVRKLPKTATAMRKGTLSPAKVEAIAAAANVDPDAEDNLLDGAETKPLAELREDCLNAKAKDRDKAHARIHRDRYAREYIGRRRRLELPRPRDRRGRCPVPGEVEAADRRAVQARPSRRPSRTARGVRVRRADRARPPLRPRRRPCPTRLRTTPRKTDEGAKPKRTPAKDLGLIRVDYETLVRGAVDGEEICEIRGLGPIPVRIARALLGEAILKLVDHQGCRRRQRHPPRTIRHGRATSRALVAITACARGRAAPAPIASRTTTGPNGEKRNTPASTSSTRSVTTTTTSRPTTAGTSSKATAADQWSHPTTPATPNTDHPSANDAARSPNFADEMDVGDALSFDDHGIAGPVGSVEPRIAVVGVVTVLRAVTDDLVGAGREVRGEPAAALRRALSSSGRQRP